MSSAMALARPAPAVSSASPEAKRLAFIDHYKVPNNYAQNFIASIVIYRTTNTRLQEPEVATTKGSASKLYSNKYEL